MDLSKMCTTSSFFFIKFIMRFVVILSESGANVDAEMCTEELDPRQCVLGYCKSECSQRHQGQGYCQGGGLGKCYCKFKCNHHLA